MPTVATRNRSRSVANVMASRPAAASAAVSSGQPDHGEDPRRDPAPRRRGSPARRDAADRPDGRRLVLVVVALRDHVDVEALGPARRSSRPRIRGAARASGCARLAPIDHLRRLLGAGEVDERRRHVVADDLPVGAAELGRAAAAAAARCRSGAGLAARPTATTCTPISPPRRRPAMRAARRTSCSPPGAPVTATTTRSRVSHGSAMPWASMYAWRSSSTRSATHSRASSRSAARLPGRK